MEVLHVFVVAVISGTEAVLGGRPEADDAAG
jgi:hypothetical protein